MAKIIDFLRARRLLRTKSCQLALEIEATLPSGLSLPEPLLLLFEWIERSGFCSTSPSGRTGHLWPPSIRYGPPIADERYGGTFILFGAQDPDDLKYWFGSENPELFARLCLIAQINGEGSRIALWLADDGTQKVVILGSCSANSLLCVLADDAVDFLRLLAIGYVEIHEEVLDAPPEIDPDDEPIYPNRVLRAWVERTFQVTIPECGTGIIRHPTSVHAETSSDLFWQWAQCMTDSPPVFTG